MILRWMVRGVLGVTVVLFLGLILSNIWVVSSTRDRVFSSVEDIPSNQVAVVLGTSSKLTDGSANPFFESRIEAAVKLFQNGKARHFILSGDNRSVYYNEPVTMKKALMNQGIPDSAITLDYAGLRTLDTIVRCKEIFGQEKVTIITQPFHCYRALFISDFYQMQAVALMADEPSVKKGGKVFFREYFARAKAILDLYVLKTTPRHLGSKEVLPL